MIRLLARRGAANSATAFACRSVVGNARRNSSLLQSVEKGGVLYFDNQATTPQDPRVTDAMLPYQSGQFGNPHSRSHAFGFEAEAAVDKARKQVADLIGAQPKDIVFTSGATESNNIALKGVADFQKQSGKNKIITLTTEHKCVLQSCRDLQLRGGCEATYLPVQQSGLVDLAKLEEELIAGQGKVAVVSIMFVNNEIGVIQPVAEIGKLCRKYKAAFHCDAAQAVGKVPIDVNEMNIDLLSISGHKLYGPKGAGALYVRRSKPPRMRLLSPVSGGGQEQGFRSGTLATPLVVGLGEACEVAGREMERDRAHIYGLSKYCFEELNKRLTHIILNGSADHRYYGNLNISFEAAEGESVLMKMPNIAVSSGSACTSAALEGSYVLRALGVKEENAHTSLRFGFGRFTTKAEVDQLIESVEAAVNWSRSLSPVWDMINDPDAGDLSEIEWTKH